MSDGQGHEEKIKPRIAIPDPCASDPAFSGRSLPRYVRAVEAAGGEPVVIPLGLSPDDLARRITACSAVLLPGSPADVDPQKFNAERNPKTANADPLRDAADELLLQDAYNLRKPIFGICYGLQSLNVWRTGSLVQDIESTVAHEVSGGAIAHQIVIEPGTLLEHEVGGRPASGGIAVNSSHHQAVEVIGDGLRVSARCPADGVVEAIEGTLPGHYVLAVQWHPERDFETDESSRRLFAGLVEAAREWCEEHEIAGAKPFSEPA
jgi:putative glutamine amidotransferase